MKRAARWLTVAALLVAGCDWPEWMTRKVTLADVADAMPFRERAYVVTYDSGRIDTTVQRVGPKSWDYDKGWFWMNDMRGPHYAYPTLVQSLKGDTLWSLDRIRAERLEKRRRALESAR